jgi:hypothetical protein
VYDNCRHVNFLSAVCVRLSNDRDRVCGRTGIRQARPMFDNASSRTAAHVHNSDRVA